MAQKIVIIGAGYAGILTAKKLAKKFKKDDNVTITVIDKNPFHTMLTELHEVAANRVDEDSIKISLKKVFAGRKVNVVLDTVQNIEFDQKRITGTKGKYNYDYLVLAAGSKPTFFGVPGAADYSFKLWSYGDAVKLKDHIHNVFRKAVVTTDPEEKKRLLSFYVVGAGFTGVEMAGELAEYVPILCEKFEIDRREVSLFNVDMLARTVPILPEKLSDKVEKRLTRMGVSVILNTGVCHIGPESIDLKKADVCTRYPAGTVIWTAGIEGSDITAEAAKSLKSTRGNRIETDAYLRSPGNDRVFIVGDNMFFIPEGSKTPVPQMVENCEQSAHTAAENIFCAITGKGEMEEYKPSFHGVMVSVGGRYGVARVGLPNRMFNLPSFLAMFSKHFINIVYFIQVLGWNKVFSYLKHEIFTIRNNRSFVGGYFTNRTPSFLMVPLRMWLGAVWLFEGIMKIVEGWFVSPKLTGFFGGANSWYEGILGGTVGSAGGGSAVATVGKAAVDAVSSATTAAGGAATTAATTAAAVADAVSSATVDGGTAAATTASGIVEAGKAVVDAVSQATQAAPEAVKSVGKAIINFNILDLVRVIFVTGKDPAQSTLNDYAFRLDIPAMNWFVHNWILPNDSMQMFMQIFIVIAEILIGLALIGGLFTTPASAFSLILQFMFVTTTGLYLGTFWMIFAGIAVLIGAGRTFGLDYYCLPYLKKQWRRLPLVKRLYIYND